MSPNTLEHLRQRFRVSVRDVFWKTCRDERLQSVCPRCRANDYWWSTPAVATRDEALELLAAHLRERHSASLYDPRREQLNAAFELNDFS